MVVGEGLGGWSAEWLMSARHWRRQQPRECSRRQRPRQQHTAALAASISGQQQQRRQQQPAGQKGRPPAPPSPSLVTCTSNSRNEAPQATARWKLFSVFSRKGAGMGVAEVGCHTLAPMLQGGSAVRYGRRASCCVCVNCAPAHCCRPQQCTTIRQDRLQHGNSLQAGSSLQQPGSARLQSAHPRWPPSAIVSAPASSRPANRLGAPQLRGPMDCADGWVAGMHGRARQRGVPASAAPAAAPHGGS